MSRALKKLMTVLGVSGMDLTRRLETSQSTVARYYSDREPDYLMAGRIEEVLGVPKGTLFALAGYTPIGSTDSVSAILADETLTEGQKFSLLFPLLDGIRAEGTDQPIDSLEAVLADLRVPTQRRRILAEMIQTYRAGNEDGGRGKRKR